MKTVAKTMVLVLLLSVMGMASIVAVSAAEDIPPVGYDEPATADFEADQEMVNYSAAARAAANVTVSDATSVSISNIENSPALRVDAAVNDIEDENEAPDEDGEYETPMAINDQPDTGRASVAVPVGMAVIALAMVPVVNRRR